MQGGVFEIAEDTTYKLGYIQTIQKFVNKHKRNPNATFAWHMAWATPVDKLEEIKLDVIPKNFFKSTDLPTDRTLTDAEKAIILESVNNALVNPLQMTQSQYTEVPVQ